MCQQWLERGWGRGLWQWRDSLVKPDRSADPGRGYLAPAWVRMLCRILAIHRIAIALYSPIVSQSLSCFLALHQNHFIWTTQKKSMAGSPKLFDRRENWEPHRELLLERSLPWSFCFYLYKWMSWMSFTSRIVPAIIPLTPLLNTIWPWRRRLRPEGCDLPSLNWGISLLQLLCRGFERLG